MFNLEEAISQRLESAQGERDKLRNLQKSLDEQFKGAVTAIGRYKKPTLTEKEITDLLAAKEHTFSTSIQTNASEKNHLREVDRLKLQRKETAEFARLQTELDGLKAQRQKVSQELREKDVLLEDLYAGERKLKAATQLKCSVEEVYQRKVDVAPEAQSRVIGKAGVMVRKLEDTHNVMIESNKTGFRICGLEDHVNQAYEALLRVANTVSEEYKLPDEVMSCLKVSFIHDLQARHSVHIDCSRSSGVCRISGLREQIEAAKDEIIHLSVMRVEVNIAKSSIPFIIGKGGATIKHIREIFDVEVEAPKSDSDSVVVIVGIRENVLKAAQFLNDLIDEKTEVVDNLESEKHILLGCMAGGNVLQSLQKEFNVKLRVTGDNKNFLSISGSRSHVAIAKTHILDMLETHIRETIVVVVPEYVTPAILGKKGVRIASIRQEHSKVNIDIIDSAVHIAGGTIEERLAAKATIDGIADSNYRSSVEMPDKTVVALLGVKGLKTRTTLFQDYQLSVDIYTSSDIASGKAILDTGYTIKPDCGVIRLRGTSSNVSKGVNLLNEYKDLNAVVEIIADSEDDCVVVQNFIGKQIETDFEVEISVNRKLKSIQVRGVQPAIANAAAKVEAILSGTLSEGSCKLQVNTLAFPSLIGKGGVTVRKFEVDYNVKIDILRSNDEIRIRGETSDAVIEARTAILDFFKAIRISETVPIPEAFADKDSFVSELIANIKNFGVFPEKLKASIQIRGKLHQVDEAKRHLEEILNNYAERSIKCRAVDQWSFVKNPKTVAAFEAVRKAELEAEKHSGDSVDLTVHYDETDKTVFVRGSTNCVVRAYDKIFGLLSAQFPHNFVVASRDKKFIGYLSGSFVQDVFDMGVNASVFLDRLKGRFFISGGVKDVETILKYFDGKKGEYDEKHASVKVDESILSIAKKTLKLVSLSEESGVTIYFDQDGSINIDGDSKESVEKAVILVNQKLKDAGKEYWESPIDPNIIGQFLGKGGVNVKQLRTTTGATIDVQDSRVIAVMGPENAVTRAKHLIIEMLEDINCKENGISISVLEGAFPVIVGAKGAVIKNIEEQAGVRVDMNRQKNIIVLKGTKKACEKGKDIVTELLRKEGLLEKPEVAVTVGSTGVVVAEVEHRPLSSIPGISSILSKDVSHHDQKCGLSKSALKRQRRKAREGTNEPSEEDDIPETPSAAANAVPVVTQALAAVEVKSAPEVVTQEVAAISEPVKRAEPAAPASVVPVAPVVAPPVAPAPAVSAATVPIAPKESDDAMYVKLASYLQNSKPTDFSSDLKLKTDQSLPKHEPVVESVPVVATPAPFNPTISAPPGLGAPSGSRMADLFAAGTSTGLSYPYFLSAAQPTSVGQQSFGSLQDNSRDTRPAQAPSAAASNNLSLSNLLGGTPNLYSYPNYQYPQQNPSGDASGGNYGAQRSGYSYGNGYSYGAVGQGNYGGNNTYAGNNQYGSQYGNNAYYGSSLGYNSQSFPRGNDGRDNQGHQYGGAQYSYNSQNQGTRQDNNDYHYNNHQQQQNGSQGNVYSSKSGFSVRY